MCRVTSGSHTGADEADMTDFQSIALEQEGYSECVTLVLLLEHGKTNHSGRLELADIIVMLG